MKVKLTILAMLISGFALGQVGGNQVFSNNNNANYNRDATKQNRISMLYLDDSSFVIEAKILKNVKADSYIAVFGLSQEAESVYDGNIKINDRIKNFISNIKKLGVKDSDIYTDIITQYRVYDYERVDDAYQAYIKGFELSKNIIIKYSKLEQIEQFLTLASQDSIFDLVKVDYVINDISKVYDELFDSVKEIIKKKKQMYVDLTNAKVKGSSQIYGENFASYYPSELYNNYTAFAQDYYEFYPWINQRDVKKLHKFQTFYYDKIDYSSFDKIINPVILEPAIQVVLTIQVKYQIEK